MPKLFIAFFLSALLQHSCAHSSCDARLDEAVKKDTGWLEIIEPARQSLSAHYDETDFKSANWLRDYPYYDLWNLIDGAAIVDLEVKSKDCMYFIRLTSYREDACSWQETRYVFHRGYALESVLNDKLKEKVLTAIPLRADWTFVVVKVSK